MNAVLKTSQEKFIQTAAVQSYLESFAKNVAKDIDNPFAPKEQVAYLLYKKGWDLIKRARQDKAVEIRDEFTKIKFWRILFSFIEEFHSEDPNLLDLAKDLRGRVKQLLEYYNDELHLKCMRDFQSVLIPMKKVVWRIDNYLAERNGCIQIERRRNTGHLLPYKKNSIELIEMLKSALGEENHLSDVIEHNIETIEKELVRYQSPSEINVKSDGENIAVENTEKSAEKKKPVSEPEIEITGTVPTAAEEKTERKNKRKTGKKKWTEEPTEFEMIVESRPETVSGVKAKSVAETKINSDSVVEQGFVLVDEPPKAFTHSNASKFSKAKSKAKPKVAVEAGAAKAKKEKSVAAGSAAEVSFQSDGEGEVTPPLPVSSLDDLADVLFNISNTLYIKNDKDRGFEKTIDLIDGFIRRIQTYKRSLTNPKIVQGADLDDFITNMLLDKFCVPFFRSLEHQLRYFGQEEVGGMLFPFYNILSRLNVHAIMSDPQNPFLPNHPRLYKIEQVVNLREHTFPEQIAGLTSRKYQYRQIPDEFVGITHTGFIYQNEVRIPARATIYTKEKSWEG